MIKTLALVSLIAASYAADTAALVPNLPDINDGKDFPFKTYSGYLNVAGTTRRLHYMFVESQTKPASDPVMIWFNGGPGCSSMLGMLTEHGPYVMDNEGTTFHENDYSWNREVNMLYIESPTGVGFSYSGTYDDYNYTDYGVAQENLGAVLDFFSDSKFPELRPNDLYLSGESYAGIYVPTLAYAINDFNAANPSNKLNLKGFMVGNGVTNWAFDTFPAYIEMGYWHGLYDLDMYNDIHKHGCPKQYEYITVDPTKEISEICEELFLQFQINIQGINIYNIFGKCFGVDPESKPTLYDTESDIGYSKVGNDILTYKKTATQRDYTPWAFPKLANSKSERTKKLQDLPPCTFGQPIIDYLNRQDVKDALHIPPAAEAWDMCNMEVNLGYERNLTASQWVYSALKGKYRMLKFSGDIDGAVPTYGTLQWINQLNWKITKKW
jgi:cathepsin A (carboxypeptidase C)